MTDDTATIRDGIDSDSGDVTTQDKAHAALAGPQAECEHDFVFLGAFDFRCDKCGSTSQDGVHPLRARQAEEHA